MKQRILFMVVMVLAGLVALPAPKQVIQAQDADNDDWDIILYSVDANDLLVINHTEIIETIDLDAYFSEPLSEVKISATNRYLAGISSDFTFSSNLLDANLIIIDRETNQRLRIPRPPIDDKKEFYYTSGDFSPDETQFVVGFVYRNPSRGGLMTFDLVSGQVTHHYYSTYEDEFGWYAFHVNWLEDGVHHERTNSPTDNNRWREVLWTPGTYEYVPTDRYHQGNRYAYLSRTNEGVSVASDYDYPHGSNIPKHTNNVIRYFHEGSNQTQNGVIYWDENDYIVSQPYWVMDGLAVLVESTPKLHTLIFRDGTQYNIASSDSILVGTPTGWLTYNLETGAIVHNTYDDSNVSTNEIGRWSGELQIVRIPALGKASTGQFASIPAYDWGEPHCEGALPSRLAVGSRGVRATDWSRDVYGEPSEASLLLGDGLIGPNDTFIVVDGPECNDGMVWWKVFVESEDENINQGTLGWISEGRETYWVRPDGTNVISQETIDSIFNQLGDNIYYPSNAELKCTGFLKDIRLSNGGRGQVLAGDPNNLRSEPLMDAELIGQIPGEGIFEVIAGPRCGSDVVWWQVDYNGTIGWTGEGIRNIYWVQPYYGSGVSPDTVTCEGFRPSRLTIGETASVTPGDANNIRSSARSNSIVLGQIPGGASFMVLDGPVCNEYTAWWQVEYEGIVGWTPEGKGYTYWLEP